MMMDNQYVRMLRVKMLMFCLLFICCFIGLSTAQGGKGPYCVDDVEGRKNVGDQWQLKGGCGLKSCFASSEDTAAIQTIGCGIVKAEPPCKVVTPTAGTKPFPECCPQVVC